MGPSNQCGDHRRLGATAQWGVLGRRTITAILRFGERRVMAVAEAVSDSDVKLGA